MKNKIKYGFLIVFFLSVVLDLYNGVTEYLQELTLLGGDKNIFGIIVFCVIVSLVSNLIKFSVIIGIYLIIKSVNKKIKKSKLSEVDLKKYDGYYRYVLSNYDIAVLSYIDNFELNYPKDIVAVLLNLKNKGKIKFDKKNNKIIISKKEIFLSRIEQYLINNIINGKVQVQSFSTDMVVEVAKDSELLKSNVKTFNFNKLFFAFLSMIIGNIVVFSLLNNVIFINNIELIIIILIILYFVLLVFIPTYAIVSFIQNIKHPYIRSEKGEEINIKLEGLKNYLKDFSTLSEKSVEEIEIWDEYLIYSVLFNQNKKIVGDIYHRYFVQ